MSGKNFKPALEDIRFLTRKEPEHFQSKTVQICSEVGVAVVFIRPIKGAPVYGATRWLNPEKALSQLSLRGKYEDLLWFTFSHAAGHILLHGKKEAFIEDNHDQTEKEDEADQFAANFLIQRNAWQKFLLSENFQSTTAVKAFAAQLEISPAIVVGRLQHGGALPYSHLRARAIM